MSGTPFSLGTRILAVGAALLALFLLGGFLLPGTWVAERTVVLDSPPTELFPLVDAPSAWQRWTEWPDSGLVASGPERGVGSRLSWDDRDLGNGSFEIVGVVPLKEVRYHVQVQDSAMHTDGTFLLAPDGEGTRVTWREEGDFGWNPLMGYWARLMERVQGRELEKALERLGTMAKDEASASPSRSPSPSR